jgi:hypothetical protein
MNNLRITYIDAYGSLRIPMHTFRMTLRKSLWAVLVQRELEKSGLGVS